MGSPTRSTRSRLRRSNRLTEESGGYRYDDTVRNFIVRSGKIKVKQPDGTLTEETVELRNSIHGPVFVQANGTVVALRVAGLDRPFGIQEYWDLDRAHGLDQFVAILERLQVPMFNMIYADKNGHILYQYNGTVPIRPERRLRLLVRIGAGRHVANPVDRDPSLCRSAENLGPSVGMGPQHQQSTVDQYGPACPRSAPLSALHGTRQHDLSRRAVGIAAAKQTETRFQRIRRIENVDALTDGRSTRGAAG